MSRVPERLRIDVWESRATLKYFPLRLHEKLHDGAQDRNNHWSGLPLIISVSVLSGLLQSLHRMRVSFGFTLYDHGVFGVNNVLLHWLLYNGWGLSDCRQRNAVSLWTYKCIYNQHTAYATDSLSRGMSRAQTLCQKSSSSAGSASAPIFTVHLVR